MGQNNNQIRHEISNKSAGCISQYTGCGSLVAVNSPHDAGLKQLELLFTWGILSKSQHKQARSTAHAHTHAKITGLISPATLIMCPSMSEIPLPNRVRRQGLSVSAASSLPSLRKGFSLCVLSSDTWPHPKHQVSVWLFPTLQHRASGVSKHQMHLSIFVTPSPPSFLSNLLSPLLLINPPTTTTTTPFCRNPFHLTPPLPYLLSSQSITRWHRWRCPGNHLYTTVAWSPSTNKPRAQQGFCTAQKRNTAPERRNKRLEARSGVEGHTLAAAALYRFI